MKKLTLDPDTLRVQSFAATPESQEPVVANPLAATRPHICDPFTLRPC